MIDIRDEVLNTFIRDQKTRLNMCHNFFTRCIRQGMVANSRNSHLCFVSYEQVNIRENSTLTLCGLGNVRIHSYG